MKRLSSVIFLLLLILGSFAYALPHSPEQVVGLFDSLQTVEVPEPSQFLLVLLGLAGLVALKRK